MATHTFVPLSGSLESSQDHAHSFKKSMVPTFIGLSGVMFHSAVVQREQIRHMICSGGTYLLTGVLTFCHSANILALLNYPIVVNGYQGVEHFGSLPRNGI